MYGDFMDGYKKKRQPVGSGSSSSPWGAGMMNAAQDAKFEQESPGSPSIGSLPLAGTQSPLYAPGFSNQGQSDPIPNVTPQSSRWGGNQKLPPEALIKALLANFGGRGGRNQSGIQQLMQMMGQR